MCLSMINSCASIDFEGTKGNGLLGLMQASASLNFDNISQNRGFDGSEIEGKLGKNKGEKKLESLSTLFKQGAELIY